MLHALLLPAASGELHGGALHHGQVWQWQAALQVHVVAVGALAEVPTAHAELQCSREGGRECGRELSGTKSSSS